MKLFTSALLLGCFALFATASEWTQNQGAIPEEAVSTIDSEVYATTYRVVIDANSLDNCTDTPAVDLSGYAWTVRVCRNVEAGKIDDLDLFLVANINNPSWSVEAKANFYVKRNGNDNENFYSRFLDWRTYTAATPSHGLTRALSATNLNNYVTGGKLRFQVEIVTKEPQPIEVEEIMESVATKIRFLVKNVSSLANGTIAHSSEKTLKGIRWNVLATKVDGNFAVSINANPNDLSTEWAIKATASISMMPCNKPGNAQCKPLRREIAQTFHKDSSRHSVNVLDWNNFIRENSDYVINDTAALQVDIKVGRKERIILFKF